MINSKITWTGNTWNPASGCSAVSAGCTNCYAARMAARFCGPGEPYEGLVQVTSLPNSKKRNKKKMIRWTGKIHLDEHHLRDPLTWRRSTPVFVDSMSDLFHRDIPTGYIRRVCDVMMQADHHVYQVLTKRHDRMRELLSTPEFEDVAQAKHIWWGVSAEDHRSGLVRIENLRHTQVRNRFVSCEPMLEDLSDIDLTGILWVIVGGESCGGRDFHLEWARALRDRCVQLGIPYLVKQLGLRPKENGKRLPYVQSDMYYRDLGRFPADLQIQQFPESMSDHLSEATRRGKLSPGMGRKAGKNAAATSIPPERRHHAPVNAGEIRPTTADDGVPLGELKGVMRWLSDWSGASGPMGCMARSAHASLSGMIQSMGGHKAGGAL